MASNYATLLTSLLLLYSLFFTIASPRKFTALDQKQPLTKKYHNGALDLKGSITLNLLWYGKFTSIQRSIIVESLNSRRPPLPSGVASWSEKYHGGSSALVVGNQILDENYSLGKSLTTSQIILLASKLGHVRSVNIVFTAKDVAVDGFCTSRCGSYGSTQGKTGFAYAWLGNSETQCPGLCAWPFHKPIHGPQTQLLVVPNREVGVDEMIINLASVEQKTEFNPKTAPKNDETPPTEPHKRVNRIWF